MEWLSTVEGILALYGGYRFVTGVVRVIRSKTTPKLEVTLLLAHMKLLRDVIKSLHTNIVLLEALVLF